LQSSLTTVLSRALGYSPRPPESVCGTVTKGTQHAAFLGSVGSPSSDDRSRLLITSRSCAAVCLSRVLATPPTCLNTSFHRRARPTLLRPRLLQRTPSWCRNINLLSITYTFRSRLRYRLTHGRIILPQETLGLRRQDFSSCLSLLMPA